MPNDPDGIDDRYLQKLTKIISKEGCPQTEGKLRVAFGLNEDDDLDEIAELSELAFCHSRAAHELKKKTIKQEARSSAAYDRFSKKIGAFSKSLNKTLALMDDDIQHLLLDRARKDGEVSPEISKKHLHDTFQRMRQLAFTTHGIISSPKGSGRPSLGHLYDYAFHLAKLYEALSGLPFKLDKQIVLGKGDAAEYALLTKGHEFVAAAVEWINEEAALEGSKFQYTSSNMYNACAEAKKRLGKASS